jgi:hypothetical protein
MEIDTQQSLDTKIELMFIFYRYRLALSEVVADLFRVIILIFIAYFLFVNQLQAIGLKAFSFLALILFLAVLVFDTIQLRNIPKL